MTNSFIALQKAADDLANKLRNLGDTDGERLIFTLCRELRDRQVRLDKIRWAVEPD